MSQPPTGIDDEAVAAADKEMEERANRAKELLSQRYKGLKAHQVRSFVHSYISLSSACFHLLTIQTIHIHTRRNKSTTAKWRWNAK